MDIALVTGVVASLARLSSLLCSSSSSFVPAAIHRPTVSKSDVLYGAGMVFKSLPMAGSFSSKWATRAVLPDSASSETLMMFIPSGKSLVFTSSQVAARADSGGFAATQCSRCASRLSFIGRGEPARDPGARVYGRVAPSVEQAGIESRPVLPLRPRRSLPRR